MSKTIKPLVEWHLADKQGNLIGPGVAAKADLQYSPKLRKVKTVTISARLYNRLATSQPRPSFPQERLDSHKLLGIFPRSLK